jgi:hypothetical protein
MRVFVSWSGERSRALAAAVRDWLPLILHYVDLWMSDEDIPAGERWALSVAQELAVSNFGIVCVTSENVTSPWVLFEAGALTKSLETSKVIPLLLDLELRDLSGPLAQFQAKKLTRAGIGEMISSLQNSAEEPIPEDRVRQLLDALWPELEKALEQIPHKAANEQQERPSQIEVLEGLVAAVRGMDARMRQLDVLLMAQRQGVEVAPRLAEIESLQGLVERLAARGAVSIREVDELTARGATENFYAWRERLIELVATSRARQSTQRLRPPTQRLTPSAELDPLKLERSALGAKSREELLTIYRALGGPLGPRTKKATLVDGILELTGVARSASSSGQLDDADPA